MSLTFVRYTDKCIGSIVTGTSVRVKVKIRIVKGTSRRNPTPSSCCEFFCLCFSCQLCNFKTFCCCCWRFVTCSASSLPFKKAIISVTEWHVLLSNAHFAIINLANSILYEARPFGWSSAWALDIELSFDSAVFVNKDATIIPFNTITVPVNV